MIAVRAAARGGISDEIVDAINALDQQALDDKGVWEALSQLSSRTQFEAVDGDPDSVVVDDHGRFQAIATVYVKLVYGVSSDEKTMSDEYVLTIQGSVSANGVVIDTIEIDTTPFYD